MSRLYDLAKQSLTTGTGRINTEGMIKLPTEAIVGKIVTIIDFDWSRGLERFPIILFKEHPNCYYFGGLVLSDLLSKIEADTDAYNELTSSGLAITVSMVPTKNGRRSYAKIDLA